MMYDIDNIPHARPTIWSKITTSSVVIAPSVPSHVLYEAFKFSGIGLLICTDINHIVEDLSPLNLSQAPGGIFDFFDRVQDCGYKLRMPLLEGGNSWCAETSIHRVGKGRLLEPMISWSQGWTKMRPAPIPTSIGSPLFRVNTEDMLLYGKPVMLPTFPL